jgi:hypothetical protein
VALTEFAGAGAHYVCVVQSPDIEDRIMKNAIRFGTLVLSLAGVAAVYAQAAAPVVPAPAADQAAQAPSDFASIDRNKDGKVSQAEAQSNTDLQSTFTTLDADRDSYLTPMEFSKWSRAGKEGQGVTSPGSKPQSESQAQPEKE